MPHIDRALVKYSGNLEVCTRNSKFLLLLALTGVIEIQVTLVLLMYYYDFRYFLFKKIKNFEFIEMQWNARLQKQAFTKLEYQK